MEGFNIKMRRIFAPFFLIVTGVVLCFAGLDYYLNIDNVADLPIWWVYLLPAAATAVLCWLVLHPGLLLLQEDASRDTKERDQGYASFYIIVAAMVLLLTWRIDLYFKESLGVVRIVKSVRDLATQKPARFYFMKNIYIDRELCGFDSVTKTPKGQNPTVYMRAVFPLRDTLGSAVWELPVAWLGIQSARQMSVDASHDSLEVFQRRAYRELRLDILNSSSQQLSDIQYLERAGAGEQDQPYRKALFRNPLYHYFSAAVQAPVLLYPRTTSFEDRTKDAGLLLVVLYVGGILAFLINLVCTDFKK
ncbi:hypothetical protein [Hymenobacter rigui]|uniref:Uncharacterized protein n=1 Tax=Hymenobacter rigui TaxID=334424 RepID=A0A3R9MPI9_9BACT|nr:hypothetical protein [Hymenobacter rigui]RSK45310.1 hypothetical protein EI291_18285 [Hymenobacter rigui]